MPEEAKKGKKPETEGGLGEKEAEVGGRVLVLYDCGWCGAGNWVGDRFAYFVCWNCHHLNYT